MICYRNPESWVFGPGRSTFMTMTVPASGVIAFVQPTPEQIIRPANQNVNGFIVSPFLDTSGNFLFASAIVLRVMIETNLSSAGDKFFYVPTLGNSPILPLGCKVFGFVLYAVLADQTQNVSVGIF